MSWDQCFTTTVSLPDGKKLVTLYDAANYISALPSAEREEEKWQSAMRLLVEAAEKRTSLRSTRTQIMRALYDGT